MVYYDILAVVNGTDGGTETSPEPAPTFSEGSVWTSGVGVPSILWPEEEGPPRMVPVYDGAVMSYEDVE